MCILSKPCKAMGCMCRTVSSFAADVFRPYCVTLDIVQFRCHLKIITVALCFVSSYFPAQRDCLTVVERTYECTRTVKHGRGAQQMALYSTRSHKIAETFLRQKEGIIQDGA